MRLNKAEIEAVIKRGRAVNSDNLSLKYLKRDKGASASKSRYAFVVSAKTAKLAVNRNLLKRRGRHIMDKHALLLKTALDMVFFFKNGALKLRFEDLEREIMNALNRAGIK